MSVAQPFSIGVVSFPLEISALGFAKFTCIPSTTDTRKCL